ncbi:protein NETWORKED 3C-like isoform X1 [Telopea speciosissima]|uniref:protein NETWORKED 3C-like isoform X1 n=1 Tax=Telopea speciosissima TaxID=54955 RepID=UPI001CC6FBF8|nr:protein NETWORKED 3C-like isoform X1 [Telopea speciosissima]
MVLLKKPSHSWWFDSRNSPRRSQWFQSTLSELDERTKSMLKLIEEDADTFAQRVEMYYKKRPELINMVEDFYRTHRSLAERFDQLKSDTGTRLPIPLDSPLHTSYRLQRSTSPTEKSYDSYSETFESEDSGESEVDDPEPEVEGQVGTIEAEEVPSKNNDSDVMKQLKGEIERIKEENRIQKVQLIEKDEEKREVIRQLSLALEILKEENVNLKKHLATKSSPGKRAPFQLNKLKKVFIGKLFSGSSVSQTSLVPL